jgi:hypothetical protein
VVGVWQIVSKELPVFSETIPKTQPISCKKQIVSENMSDFSETIKVP